VSAWIDPQNPRNRAANVGNSGLRFHTADSGVNEYFVTAGTAIYLSRTWVVGANVRYSRLAGDAEDSPIVDNRGDPNQWIVGLGVGYMWR
jgi:MipA family protein